MEIRIREPQSGDTAAVRRLVEAAFEGAAEARLVARLRGRPDVFELVALAAQQLVGHILFSPVTIPGLTGKGAVGLAPLAVDPAFQKRGVGGCLTRAGLEECRRRGHPAVVLLGHTDYYPRFGFNAASTFGLHCKWAPDSPAFQLLELEPGALAGCAGRVEYDTAFDAV